MGAIILIRNKSGMEIKKILTEYFTQNEKVIMAFLYGSYAKGTALADSDVDIAVYLANGYSKNDVDQIWDELSALIKMDVELLILNEAKESIGWSAVRGKALVIKDWKLYLKYMLSVSFDAMDFQNVVEDIWKMKRKLKHA